MFLSQNSEFTSHNSVFFVVAKVNCDFLSCNSDFFLGILNVHLTIQFFYPPQKLILSRNSDFSHNSEFASCNSDFFLIIVRYNLRFVREKSCKSCLFTSCSSEFFLFFFAMGNYELFYLTFLTFYSQNCEI